MAEDDLTNIINAAFDDDPGEAYDFLEELDLPAPLPDDAAVAARYGLNSQKARMIKLTGSGGINKAATDINEYSTAVFLITELCRLAYRNQGGLAPAHIRCCDIRTATPLMVSSDWEAVTQNALENTTRAAPTIEAALQAVPAAGGGGGGAPPVSDSAAAAGVKRKSSTVGEIDAFQEANRAVITLMQKGKSKGGAGIPAMEGLIRTKIDQGTVMALAIIKNLQTTFHMNVTPYSKLPLVQVVGATQEGAARKSHKNAVKLFCDRYGVPFFYSFAHTPAGYSIIQKEFDENENYHKRSPADILVAIDGRCFNKDAGPVIVGFSLKSVLTYNEAPFANPGLPSVFADLRERLGGKLVPKDIAADIRQPYNSCINHFKKAAGVKTNEAIKELFKKAKWQSRSSSHPHGMKLGQKKDGHPGAQDILRDHLAGTNIPVNKGGLGGTAQQRRIFCKNHLVNVRNKLRDIFMTILDDRAGQQAMKKHILALWRKSESPIYWFKVTGQGASPEFSKLKTVRRHRSAGYTDQESYQAKFQDPNMLPTTILLRNPASVISVLVPEDNDTKVSFILIISLGREQYPLFQIRAKRESWIGTSIKLSGERCPKGVCARIRGAGGGGGGGGAGNRGKKKGGSRRKRRTRCKRRSRRKRRHPRKKKHHVRRRRRRTRRKKY